MDGVFFYHVPGKSIDWDPAMTKDEGNGKTAMFSVSAGGVAVPTGNTSTGKSREYICQSVCE